MMIRISLLGLSLLVGLIVQGNDGFAQTLGSGGSYEPPLLPRVYSGEQLPDTPLNNPAFNQGNFPIRSVVNYRNSVARNAAIEAPRQPLIGAALTVRTKPFSQVEFGPTVSPYTDLNDPLSTAEDYYNITRALENQRLTNASVAKRQYVLEQQVSQIPIPGPSPIISNASHVLPGQPSTFRRYGHHSIARVTSCPPLSLIVPARDHVAPFTR